MLRLLKLFSKTLAIGFTWLLELFVSRAQIFFEIFIISFLKIPLISPDGTFRIWKAHWFCCSYGTCALQIYSRRNPCLCYKLPQDYNALQMQSINPLGSEGQFRKTDDFAILWHLCHFNQLYIPLSQGVSYLCFQYKISYNNITTVSGSDSYVGCKLLLKHTHCKP